MASLRHGPALLAALLLGACSILGTPPPTLETLSVPAGNARSDTVVVVLPGILTDAGDMRDEGVGRAIQRGWPGVDVVLTSATFNYYRAGIVEAKLHDQVITPLREQGYRHVWLAGGSLGGLGLLLYEYTYPGQVDGLVLISPFLGDEALDEIRDAGSLQAWEPGPLPAVLDQDNFDRQIWSMIREWPQRPSRGDTTWLACGYDDSMFEDAELLAGALPEGHFLPGPGGHNWDYWIPALERVFAEVARSVGQQVE